ncbi:MAG: succinylglutamate desuccinylase/aspartoacylase family protein [Candidatus Microsaccharimonas sp.]
MKRVTLLAAMHGIETYGIDLHKAFTERFPELVENVQLIIGNELAYEKQVRYIDVDMNRHYGQPEDAHESEEIQRIEQQLEAFQPDYIIDIHTTKRDSGVFFISDIPNTTREVIFDMIPVDICIMKDSVINKSFIGHHNNAVSLEYSLRFITDDSTEAFVNALANVINEKPNNNHGSVYDVSHLISKDEWLSYPGIKNYDTKSEGVALMVPADSTEMDAEYYGFWCTEAEAS